MAKVLHETIVTRHLIHTHYIPPVVQKTKFAMNCKNTNNDIIHPLKQSLTNQNIRQMKFHNYKVHNFKELEKKI